MSNSVDSSSSSAESVGAATAAAPGATFKLSLKADSGYESETNGRCTPDQYGRAMAALHGNDQNELVATPKISDQPSVDACIEAVMAAFPGTSALAQSRYYEAVHQELAPLARYLERELTAANERITALEAERDALKVDAERYRWLRDEAHPDAESGIAVTSSETNDWGKWYTKHWCQDSLDGVIDAARDTDGSCKF